jgi:hypothetical protein
MVKNREFWHRKTFGTPNMQFMCLFAQYASILQSWAIKLGEVKIQLHTKLTATRNL